MYILDQQFLDIPPGGFSFEQGEYECCRFVNCNLSNANLRESKFIECEFVNCDLSGAIMDDVSMQDIAFIECKLLGVFFERCNSFGFSLCFKDCILDHASFYKMKLSKTTFVATRLREVDFTEADLSAASFVGCDLLNARFDHTILEKVDFRTAVNYIIDPESNRLKGARFSPEGLPGLLDKYKIVVEAN